MAQKRMFSPEIVGSDAFIEMSMTAQCLYFHLGMRADDDGFVNPQVTMRMIGANADDLRILIAKRFLLQFESGVVVVKHWRINNFVRKDRYKPSNYLDEKSVLRVKENQSYTLDASQGKPIYEVPWKSDAEIRSTIGQPDDNTLVNAGKVRLGKVRIEKDVDRDKVPCGEFKNVFLTPEEKKKLVDRYGRSATIQIVDELSTYMKSKGKAYRDHYATLLNWAKRKGVVEKSPPLAPPPDLKISPEEAAHAAKKVSEMTKALSERKTFKI